MPPGVLASSIVGGKAPDNVPPSLPSGFVFDLLLRCEIARGVGEFMVVEFGPGECCGELFVGGQALDDSVIASRGVGGVTNVEGAELALGGVEGEFVSTFASGEGPSFVAERGASADGVAGLS